jgi:outer membrane protein OmpA-like peptidoglycan-associated protein
MNAREQFKTRHAPLISIAVASALLAACAAAPVKPPGADEARAKLSKLESDPNLGSRAPAAIADAEVAVRTAEQPQSDPTLAQHNVYIADRKVAIATQLAQTRYYEDQRAALETQQASSRLAARTREADASKSDAAQARSTADAANAAAAASAQQSAELQRQVDALNAKITDRGIVLTLGDVLFTTGQSDLRAGTTERLDKLVAFLNQYPDRSVVIEGYTDSVGSESYNQGLSERRAQSVRTYLRDQGIEASRLTASGRGESDPVADNQSATGRQQNRRVEVIIANPPAQARR